MSETIKQWLKDLYTSEIEEATLTIANERIWLKGSEGDEEAMFNHSHNIEENEEYIRILNQKIEELENEQE